MRLRYRVLLLILIILILSFVIGGKMVAFWAAIIMMGIYGFLLLVSILAEIFP